MSRGIGILLLLLLAAVGGVLGIGALANLFADYKDSPDSTYLFFGLPFVFISVASLARLLSLLRSHWRRPLMALVWMSSAAALGTAVPGSLELGSPFWESIVIAVLFLAIWIALIAPWHRRDPATAASGGGRGGRGGSVR